MHIEHCTTVDRPCMTLLVKILALQIAAKFILSSANNSLLQHKKCARSLTHVNISLLGTAGLVNIKTSLRIQYMLSTYLLVNNFFYQNVDI